MNERRHRLAIVYTIIIAFFVAAFSYWQLNQVGEMAVDKKTPTNSPIEIQLESIF